MLIIASTDLQKEIVEGERVRSHTLRSKTGSWVFYFQRSGFRFPFLSSRVRWERKSRSVRLTLLFCFAGWRAEPPSRSSTPETPAGPRDSSLLPRLWDGEPQRWCKSVEAQFHFSTDSILGWLLVWESRSGSFFIKRLFLYEWNGGCLFQLPELFPEEKWKRKELLIMSSCSWYL